MSDAPTVDTPWWKRALPIAFALLLIGYVLLGIDFAAFTDALEPRALLGLLLFALVWNVALLTADAFATTYVYRDSVCPVRFSELWVIRGASYLPSLLNHHVGQGWVTYFLSKVYNASLWRVAGATLVVYLSTFACLVVFSSLALLLGFNRVAWMLPAMALLVAAGVGFLIVVAVRPAFLMKRSLMAPALELGVAGHLRTVLLRMPHILVLFLGSWIPLLMFDVDVPFTDALGLIPPVLLVAALPITPQGVGTRDALSVHLFASYAAGPQEQAAARVLASTLSWVVSLILVQIVFSPLLMRRAYRLLKKPEPAGFTS